MKARTSKIARLPFKLREQLNHRLQNGDFGQPLLDWLNQKPAIKHILIKWFHGQPINKQNLSDWRHGGYQDWLRHQSRQQTLQRVLEQDDQLREQLNTCDLYEAFSRIAITEMADEFEHLHEITDRNERWTRLREITRDLSRLQHGYNHSRSVELAWTKRSDQCEDFPDDETVKPSQAQSSEIAVKNLKNNGALTPPTQPAEPVLKTVERYIYHRRCGRGCVCPDCHPEDGEYPYTQAVKDDRAHKDNSSPYWNRGTHRLWVTHVDCDCYCDCEKTHPYPTDHIPNAV